jgi:adiponectin receptor
MRSRPIRRGIQIGETLTQQRAAPWTVEPYILSGYRPAYGRVVPAAWSITRVHNETLNIWSHAAAACFFTHAALTDTTISAAIRGCISVHAALYCTSTTAHTFGAVSERTNRLLFTLDKSMISFMFLASGLCAVGIEFARHPLLPLICAVMCACCACVVRAICDPSRSSKVLNVLALGAQMFCAASPAAHLVYSNRSPELARQVSWAAARAIVPSMVGGAAYALRVPERLAPGRFDLALHSHNVMHVGTAIGSYWTYVGLAEWEAEAVRSLAE